MCGISGIVNLKNSEPIDCSRLLEMRDALRLRGPDDAGHYNDQAAGLASRRLAILDLSPRGHMPMPSADRRYWIVHNGEVYNYGQLRQYLEGKGYRFQSNTDTEVLLYLYVEHGADMLSRCNGMFAFAIWDAQEQTLFAARDRMGIKPFYYTVYQGKFYFASEEKALFAAGVPAEFDETTWPELLLFRYVSGQRTPYRSIYRLLPGHYLVLRNGNVQTYRWWSLDQATSGEYQAEPAETQSRFQQLFDDSVALRRISDVPLGVLLSGGLDSSAVASTLAAQSGQGVASFTVRFSEADYDEGPLARMVAEQWGLQGHEMYVPQEKTPSLLAEATWLLDEPLVHGNDIHLLAIARYAKPYITVLLSGEGADELLGGYVRYRLFLNDWALPILSNLARVVGTMDLVNGRWRKAIQTLSYPYRHEQVLFSSAEPLPAGMFHTPPGNGSALEYRHNIVAKAAHVHPAPVRQMMFYEQHTYLQSILDRNDRMTMGASIECRVPYLDHQLVEWVAQLPTNAFFKGGQSKKLLRDALGHR